MAKIHDDTLVWRPLGARFESECQVQIFNDLRSLSGDGMVIILTEHPNNKGRSVTNGCEEIATIVLTQNRFSTHQTVWIEHYVYDNGDPDTWDQIKFSWKDGHFVAPEWNSVHWFDIAKAIGHPNADWHTL